MKIPKNRTTRPILDQQSLHELKNMRGNTGLFIIFQLYTGLRMMEICRLKWGDVLADNHEPKHIVRFYISKQSRKGNPYGFYREMPLHQELKTAILEEVWRNRPALTDYIFKSEANRKSNGHITRQGMCSRIRKALEDKPGVEYPASHALRKTFAYFLYEHNGRDIALVRQAMGHRSDEVTMRYLKIGIGDLAPRYENIKYGY